MVEWRWSVAKVGHIVVDSHSLTLTCTHIYQSPGLVELYKDWSSAVE